MATIYDSVTEEIIDALNQNVMPWVSPNVKVLPQNYKTKNVYSGINHLLLNAKTTRSNKYLTFAQCNEMGGAVLKGSKARTIIFYGQSEKENEDGEKNKFSFLKSFNVFSLADTTLYQAEEEEKVFFDHEKADSIINNYLSRENIAMQKTDANNCYSVLKDTVFVAKDSLFKSLEEKYCTLFHEIAHSTGAEKRLYRYMCGNLNSEDYAFEELVAEISASFLASHFGFAYSVSNSASYIASWLSALQNDKKYIFRASACAQKAVNYILGK